MRQRALVVCVAAGCGAGTVGTVNDTGLDGLMLASVNPTALVPGSALVVTGDSFVDQDYGASALRMKGSFAGATIDLAVPLGFTDYQHLGADWKGARAAGLPADMGTFDGMLSVEVRSTIDGRVHTSNAVRATLDVAPMLAPRLDNLGAGVIYVNQPIDVVGGGLLLGGGEGQTTAMVSGCYQREDASTCDPVAPVAIPVVPASAFDRAHGTFAFAPTIAGIRPGHFQGQVALKNGTAMSGPKDVGFDVVTPAVFTVSPAQASLGQIVDIEGGGFVGDPNDASAYTLLTLAGTFSYDGDATEYPVALDLVPGFVSGPHVQYVINEDDTLGQSIDLRKRAGTFTGTIQPVIHYAGDVVRGEAAPVTLGLAHIKQVTWIRFLPSYTESLRHFGLRAADALVRERVLAIAHRDYAGINVDFRTEQPTDFAVYTTVDIGGPDLNGLGLFGYDNSPGKDVGNVRLYDQVGGFYAITQQDGSLGYGGVFVESFFSFSQHPNGLAMSNSGAAAEFDAVFDPFRPDIGGQPVLAADLAGVTAPTSGAGCPASGDRPKAVACAVWVMGSMVGSTMTHEFGHSLGLAAGGGQDHVHNDGDRPNRLMDTGGARPFLERAEIKGQGPAVFCDGDYSYLRDVLPAAEGPADVARPPCN
jgi:hypothetical protein